MKTSSLTSTKPPTAVSTPRKISASFKTVHGLLEGDAGGGEAWRGGGGEARHRVDDAPGLGVADRLAVGEHGLPRLVAHLVRISVREAPRAVEPLDRAPFGEDRAGALGGGELLVLRRRASGRQQQGEQGEAADHGRSTPNLTPPFRKRVNGDRRRASPARRASGRVCRGTRLRRS